MSTNFTLQGKNFDVEKNNIICVKDQYYKVGTKIVVTAPDESIIKLSVIGIAAGLATLHVDDIINANTIDEYTSLKKSELIEYARSHNINITKGMTKAQIINLIENK